MTTTKAKLLKLPPSEATRKKLKREVLKFLDLVVIAMNEGREKTLQPNLFCRFVLSQVQVDKVIGVIERNIEEEIAKYPNYHKTHQGIGADEYLISMGFDKLAYPQRLFIVQKVCEIFQQYQ